MKLIRTAGAICCVAVALIYPRQAQAWGCEGHQVVAFIAERQMNPTALENANALLTQFPITIHRNCQTVGTTPMSDAATWADDVRFVRPETAGWHFIDVPFASAGGDPEPFCNDNCVMFALRNQIAVLKDPSSDPEKQAEALRFIIHFAGDIHQPLHAVTNADRGGNCVPIFLGGRKPHLSKGSFSPELHGIWDTQLVEALGDDSGVDSPEALAQLLNSEITPQEKQSWIGTDPDAWARESGKAATTVAYAGLTRQDGTAISASDIANSEVDNKCSASVEQQIVAMQIQPNDAYLSSAEEMIEQRLKQAGVRLADILDQIWPDQATSAHKPLHRTAK
jgi:hypothetical protein